ncbi:hypothetical protein BKA93DRAFT_493457 [Sparassis latifolia]
MPTFSDGDDSVEATKMSDLPIPSLSSPGDMRLYLQNLLDDKEKELQQAGTLGQQLLAQRMELEERTRQLQEMDLEGETADDDDLDVSVRERFRDLAHTIKAWDGENEQLLSLFWEKPLTNGTQLSPASRHMDISRNEVDRSLERSKASTAGPSAVQSSRRAKNAAHRADDVEFAFEIGSGLLTEVRRLQSLLAERDKAIQDMKEEKDDLEKTLEDLRTTLRQQGQSADKFKEENWNLEVSLQELRTQLSDSQASVQRLEGEHKRLTKMLTSAREAADQHKNEAERQQNAFLELKAKHETEVAHSRKHAASLQRDKSDLQQTLDSMKAEAARAKRFPRLGSPLTPNGSVGPDALTPSNADEDDVFGGTTGGASTNNRKRFDNSLFPPEGFGSEFGDSSPEPSPSKPFLAPNHPSNENEALQQRLAHAQRQISTLKGALQREKELRIEYKRKLDSSPGYAIEEEVEEIEEENERPKPRLRLTPYRSGRGRGRGRSKVGLTLIQRLGMAANSPSSEYNGDDDDLHEPSSPPPVPPLPAAFQTESNANKVEQEEEEEPDLQASPSPPIPSNRTSVDGLDPVFANVLRRSASGSSVLSNGSPLHRSVLARTSRGGTLPRRSRGGAAYQETRPPSLVGQPEALADELGLMEPSLDGSLVAEQETLHDIQTAEFGCQTDPEEVLPPPPSPPSPPPPILVSPATTEIAIQVDPEPLPEAVKSDVSLQTDEEVSPILLNVGVQHEVVVPEKVYASSSTNTDPEPEQPQPTLAQAQVQTSTVDVVDVDTQTIPEPASVHIAKVDMDTQTPLPTSVEMEVQTSVLIAEVEVQVDNPPLIEQSLSFGDSSGDTTIHALPASSLLSVDDVHDLDYDSETETGSVLPTDADDYQDARQSMSLTTPTDSMDDFHSIRTVSDNDFSSEDEEDNQSIKASRLPSRQAITAPSSAIDMVEPSPMSPTAFFTPALMYEDKAVSADILEELQFTEPAPEEPKVEHPPEPQPEPKPELKEMSIQTDEWSPPPVATVPPSVSVTVPSPVFASGSGSSSALASGQPLGPSYIHSPIPSPGSSAVPASVPVSVSASFPALASPSDPDPAPVAVLAKVPMSASVSTAPTAAPSPTPVPALIRVSNASQQQRTSIQQFQFISPPSSAGPTTTSLPIVSAPSSNASIRESNATFISRPRTSHSDRRQSIESTLSSVMDDLVSRSRTPSNVPNVIDKSRPPMMLLPPPPRQPPPPNSMLPPPFIPEKRFSHEIPPPRPSSPPPAELIQRATTPTFGSALAVPGSRAFGFRQHGSMPPSQGLRQLPSTSSFRSAANAAARAPLSSPTPSTMSFGVRERERRELSSTSLTSGRQSMGSQRSSISSDHVSEQHSQKRPAATATPDRTMGMDRSGNSTDPAIIHAITQTMIGEFLYKYTRRAIGKGHGSSRHKRFFWVHPYTRTLYWSSADPGSSNVSESSAKSAYIENVRAVLDPNPMPPGIYQYSVVVSTPQREMKFTAPTKERHDIWINALKYLLSRPGAAPVNSPGGAAPAPLSPMSLNGELPDDVSQQPRGISSPQSQRSALSGRTALSVESWNVTPRGQRSQSQLSLGGSMGKRSGTPAAEYLRWAGHDNLHSPTKEYEQIAPQDDDDDVEFELHDDTMSDDGFEGLENVRACCDGRHTVGRSGKIHHHHHHTHTPRDASRSRDQHLDTMVQDAHPPRPASPAWSFRSRAGSSTSHDGGSFFSRFGTRRSAKAVPGISVGAHDQ